MARGGEQRNIVLTGGGPSTLATAMRENGNAVGFAEGFLGKVAQAGEVVREARVGAQLRARHTGDANPQGRCKPTRAMHTHVGNADAPG